MRTVQVGGETDSEGFQQPYLQTEVQEPKAKLNELNKQSQSMESSYKKESKEQRKNKSDTSNVQHLRKEVKALKTQLTVMSVRSKQNAKEKSQYPKFKADFSPKSTTSKSKTSKEADYFFLQMWKKWLYCNQMHTP